MLNLSMLQPGQRGLIKGININGKMRRRLMDMGIIPGEVVKVEKIAPLGDPVELIIKNYRLSLRKKEAESIFVELVK
ncbi:MAG: iron transporter FeoA [Nitrospirae bacterium]|nr:MAG: iron transporter FeoA [Nitrospirota bacterium]